MKSKIVNEPASKPKKERKVTAPKTVEEIVEPEVERVEAEVVTTGTVIANLLNIRQGASTSFLPIGTLKKGDKVEYTVENDEWLKLTTGGYVMKQFIQ